VSLIGIADAVPEAAARLAGEVGTRPRESLEALLDAGAEAVYVTTPNTHHVEPVVRALKHGVHVFSEKPMATSLREAGTIRDAARHAKGIYQIGFNRRFANVYRFAKRLIDDGRLAPIAAQLKHNRGELQQRSGRPIRGSPAAICTRPRCTSSTWPGSCSVTPR